jgi:aspartyl protease
VKFLRRDPPSASLSTPQERVIFDTRPGVAELADALDSKTDARHLLKPAHLYSRLFRLYQEGRLPGFQRCASLLILAHREVIDKLKEKAGRADVAAPNAPLTHTAEVTRYASSRYFITAMLLGFLLGLVLCLPAHAQERRTFTVPFHTVRGMILLDGQINGKLAVFLLDTGANNSVVDYRAAGFDSLKLDALRSTGSAGAEGACTVREVKLSLEHRSWFGRRVCVMNLSDAGKRMGVQIDGFIGQDVLREFSTVRIDYKAQTVTLED